MRKIEKNVGEVPKSLRMPPDPNSPDHSMKANQMAVTTHERRTEVHKAGAYIDTDSYNSRYKQDDTTALLSSLYLNKCAYCEQRVEQFHVEHYRPKAIYFWLAFSWDNLLMVCPFCNWYKGTKFEIQGAQATQPTEIDSTIHSLSLSLDSEERPMLVNPEVTDPVGMLDFEKDGNISSTDPRFDYTIKTCRLHRKYLRDQRYRILDELRNDFRAQLVDHNDLDSQKAGLRTIFSKFKRNAEDPVSEFTAFRKYLLQHWMGDLLKETLA